MDEQAFLEAMKEAEEMENLGSSFALPPDPAEEPLLGPIPEDVKKEMAKLLGAAFNPAFDSDKSRQAILDQWEIALLAEETE